MRTAATAPTNRLYRNNRDGTFTDVTLKAGLTRTGWGQGCCVGDYNNDGLPDIFVTAVGQSRLFRNRGDGTFQDVTEASGLGKRQAFSTSALWVDYDRDGRLDLFVSRYVHVDLDNLPEFGKGTGKGEGRGATFTVRLPRHRPASAKRRDPAEAPAY